jgi:DNA-binding NarL/FixJ family response regulator
MSLGVLIVDDQALVRAGFRMILEAEEDMEVVGEAANGREAITEAQRARPDVILMDVRMPGVDGIEATRRLVASGTRARVLILTTFDLDEYAFAALRAGASGFLLKDVPSEQLTAAIRAVAAGDAVVAPRVTRRLLDSFAHRRPDHAGEPPRAAGENPRLLELTAREREVMLEVAAGRSNAEIAERLVVS